MACPPSPTKTSFRPREKSFQVNHAFYFNFLCPLRLPHYIPTPCCAHVFQTRTVTTRQAAWQDPGSSYIWLSRKVTSNLSQIPNNFCLFLPEILNSGQSVSHDFQKRKFHVINHLSERSERTVISTRLYLVLCDSTWLFQFPLPTPWFILPPGILILRALLVPWRTCGVEVNANQSLSAMSVRTFACSSPFTNAS